MKKDLRKRESKLCPSCEEVLAVDMFYKDKSRPDGRCGYCKACCSKKASENHFKKTGKHFTYKNRVPVVQKQKKSVKEAILTEMDRHNWDVGVVMSLLRNIERQRPIKFEGNKKYSITPDDMRTLVWAAARACHTTPDGVYSKSRSRENLTARGFVCKELFDRGVTAYTIGKLLNGRQKGHIKTYVKNTNEWLNLYNDVQFDFNRFQKMIT